MPRRFQRLHGPLLLAFLVTTAAVVDPALAAPVQDATPSPEDSAEAGERLRRAAQKGDLATVKALLAAGTPVDSASEYGATALFKAADKGHLEVVKALVEAGANVNARDTFYSADALTWAAYNGRGPVVAYLAQAGATSADAGLSMAISRGKLEAVQALLESDKVSEGARAAAFTQAKEDGSKELVALFERAGVVALPPANAEVPSETLELYVGRYVALMGPDLVFTLGDDGGLEVTIRGQGPNPLGALDTKTFRMKANPSVSFTFEVEDGAVARVKLHQGEQSLLYNPEVRDEADSPAEADAGGTR